MFCQYLAVDPARPANATNHGLLKDHARER
jgi:hypothetical protein